jgi:hypothetical protein
MPTATKTRKTAVNPAIRAIIELSPLNIDRQAIAVLLGDAAAKTHGELAAVFGVKPATITQTWSPDGMPGRHGNYPLADVLVWYLERDRRSGSRLSIGEVAEQKKRVELQIAEATLQRLEREEAEATGKLIAIDDVVRLVCTTLAVLSERLNNLPHHIAPLLAADKATHLLPPIESAIQRELKLVSDTLARGVLVNATDAAETLLAYIRNAENEQSHIDE